MSYPHIENPLLSAEIDLRTGLNIFDDSKNPHYCEKCGCDITYEMSKRNDGYCDWCIEEYTCNGCGRVCEKLDVNGYCEDCAPDLEKEQEE